MKGESSGEWDSSSFHDGEPPDIKPDIQQLQLQMLGNVNQAQKQIQNTLASAAAKSVPICPRRVVSPTMVAYPEMAGDTTDEGKVTLASAAAKSVPLCPPQGRLPYHGVLFRDGRGHHWLR